MAKPLETLTVLPKPGTPLLLKVLGLSAVAGSAAGVMFVSILLTSNVAGMSDLIWRSAEPMLPLFLIYVFHALTFASVSMGITIMAMPYED